MECQQPPWGQAERAETSRLGRHLAHCGSCLPKAAGASRPVPTPVGPGETQDRCPGPRPTVATVDESRCRASAKDSRDAHRGPRHPHTDASPPFTCHARLLGGEPDPAPRKVRHQPIGALDLCPTIQYAHPSPPPLQPRRHPCEPSLRCPPCSPSPPVARSQPTMWEMRPPRQ